MNAWAGKAVHGMQNETQGMYQQLTTGCKDSRDRLQRQQHGLMRRLRRRINELTSRIALFEEENG
jgi:hypothetical protein